MSCFCELPHGDLPYKSIQSTRKQIAALLDLDFAKLHLSSEAIATHAVMQRGPDRFPFLYGMS